MNVFLSGALCHPPALQVVLSRDAAAEPAILADHRLYWAEDLAGPFLCAEAGAQARGVLLQGLSDLELARLAFYAASLGQVPVDLQANVSGQAVLARTFLAAASQLQVATEHQVTQWSAMYGATITATAVDVMARYGLVEPEAVERRYGQMLVRGASRARASEAAPVTRRFVAGPTDVSVSELRQPYANFFALEEYDLSFRRFDGSYSPVVTRAVFVSGDAVTVLPYDRQQDRVLVIEQFRAGPWARGDTQPWAIEAIAGRIDPGESPDECARREALEEAGLVLDALLPVAQYYPSTGAISEYLYSYVALVDLPDGIAGVFGVEGEAEDIAGHLIDFDELMALVASGEVANAPLILTALWLQRERGRLRHDFSVQ